jgi:hypothetical protein
MKKNYKLFLSGILALGFTALTAQAPTPDLFHYTFNGTGSLVANTASAPPAGTATGTLMGAQTQTGAINCMSALVGSGNASTTDYLNTNWAPSLGSGAWTLSFWTASITPSSTLFYIFGDINTGSLRIFTNGVAGAGNWILRGGFTDVLLTGAATMTPNMISFVYSPTVSAIVGYINGVPTTTVSQSAMNITGTGPLKVGGYSSSTGLNSGGLIADFRLYSSELTSTDVLNIYNEGVASLSLSVAQSSSVCPGQTASLSVSGANTYSWDNGATTANISVTPTASTVYTVTGFAGTCTTSATSSVNVLTPAVLSVNNGTICTGASFTINPSGASTYTIQGGNAVVSPTASSTYSVVGTGTNGCVTSAVTSSVQVNNLPVVSATSSSTLICVGQTASLTASGASSYMWNTTATTAVIAVSPTTTTNYTVTGTDANSCSASFTISQAVSNCTGIENNSLNSQLNVYPNPSNGEFMIELNNGQLNTIVISDVTGRVILTQTTTEKTISFNISNYTSGIYFVAVKNNASTENIRIIKQ